MNSEEGESRRNVLLWGAVALGAAGTGAIARAQGTSGTSSNPTPANVPRTEGGAAAQVYDGAPSSLSTRRTAQNQRAWVGIAQSIETEFGLAAQSLTQPLQLFMSRVEDGFVFRAESQDTDFSYLHVEPLLDQAADLFERGIRERTSWDDLASKATSLALELTEYAALDRIHAEEEQAGVYEVGYRVASADFQGESINSLRLGYAKTLIDSAISHQQTVSYEVYNAFRKSAWVSGLVAYSFGDGRFNGYVTHTWDGQGFTVANLATNAAEHQANYNLSMSYFSLAAQSNALAAGSEASQQRRVGLRFKADWEQKNRDFQKRRTTVAREMQDRKAKAATDPNGLLNYSKRLPAIKTRFQSDFRDALARIQPAALGLAAIYGYVQPLPTDASDIDYFDNCLLWTRRAVHWLIRFARQEQSIVVPISIRAVLGEDAFKRAVRSGRITFDITEAAFPGMRHIRLRGLSACTRSDQDDDPSVALQRPILWQLALKLPPSALVRHLGGSTAALDQRAVPPCLLYRVTRRSFTREPDVFGSSALHNCSPIGTWQVAVNGSMPPRQDLDDIKDIELDLHLGFRGGQGG